jgi:excinuclease ABC subunit A
VSGSGKSSLVSQVLVELVADYMGTPISNASNEEEENPLENTAVVTLGGKITEGIEYIKRLVVVDQKPIGRTPRSNLATYTGLFDNIRKLFASTKLAKSRKYDAGRFSFNVAKGRCPHCQGEGFVMVELLFLPSVYSPCPTCEGARYNPQTLEVRYNDKNIADVLAMTVDHAHEFFADDKSVAHSLEIISKVGLGYLRLGQPATELSGGEAQRIKLANELQRKQHGNTLYILDEPTTGLHPSDVEKLMVQLQALVDAGNTVIVVEHDMEVIAASDWVIDVGPGAGSKGGTIVVEGTPGNVSTNKLSRTAPYLLKHL